MGIPDTSLIDLFEKVRSWISWAGSDFTCFSGNFDMPSNSSAMCSECESSFTDFCVRYNCQHCGKVMCGKCAQGCDSAVSNLSKGMRGASQAEEDIKSCKFCAEASFRLASERRNSGKIHPSASPRHSPEPPSPSFIGGIADGSLGGEEIQRDGSPGLFDAREHLNSPHAMTCSSMASFSDQLSPASIRNDEEEAEEPATHFFCQSSEYCRDFSDIEISRFRANHVFHNSNSLDSSPSDSPSRINFAPNRVGHSVQREQDGSPKMQPNGSFGQDTMAVLERPEAGTKDPDNIDDCTSDLSTFHRQCEQKPLDFENNGLIWFPPPPEDEDDEQDSNFFQYDDDDDDIGESGAMFSSSCNLGSMFPAKEKHNEENKEPMRVVVQSHFRALVAQLLQGEDIISGQGNSCNDWLDIVTKLAWQAANFVKPDTSRGGSMDPVDYVKVKCIATGSPSDSTFIKGVVCTKNIKHKRMTSQYKSPRLLILGGALEYQRLENQFASFNMLLQQEIDHLKMIVSRIEAHRPNVLLVEKSVSSYAQEYLLAKEISLVLNVKRPVLERIGRCTGALITPSVDNITTTRLGHCELFRVERMSEELESANQLNKKLSKTLMFFEGCPRRLGCTVLLKGTCREELKKVKHVVQYAVFAAYHLSLETSFLADEGASLPKVTLKSTTAGPEISSDSTISVVTNSNIPSSTQEVVDFPAQSERHDSSNPELRERDSLLEHLNQDHLSLLPSSSLDNMVPNEPSNLMHHEDLVSDEGQTLHLLNEDVLSCGSNLLTGNYYSSTEYQGLLNEDERQLGDIHEMLMPERTNENEVSSEYFPATDSHQSILVSFSSRCVAKGTVCERSRLLRIKFYGCFDKPLGRYLRDDLFDQTSYCRSCEEPAEAHIQCFTHQQGSLTISVRCLANIKLPGERDGKIWMWHRCLRCAHIDGIPPATRRVVMSDAAWGLSFGKFLELSFSNHATANRVATCGHSLQRDCLRYYGFGNMVGFFRYSPIDVLSVCLPPSMLEFDGRVQQEWIRKEAAELMRKIGILYTEISDVLDSFEEKSSFSGHAPLDANELFNHVMELKDLVEKERNDYSDVLQSTCGETSTLDQLAVDILDLNRLRRTLLIGSHVWDRRLYSLDSLLRAASLSSKSNVELKDLRNEMSIKDEKYDSVCNENISESIKMKQSVRKEFQLEHDEESSESMRETCAASESIVPSTNHIHEEERETDGEIPVSKSHWKGILSSESNLSDKIDSVWTGTDQLQAQVFQKIEADGPPGGLLTQSSQIDNLPIRRLTSQMRVYSFDSATRFQDRIHRGLPPSSLHLSTLRSFHASGDYRSMVRDPVSNILRTYSQVSPQEIQDLSHILKSKPSVVLSASSIVEGARLLLPQSGRSNIVIAVYDNEPTSIISHALSSKEYEDWIYDKPYDGSLDLDYIHYGSYGSEGAASLGSLFTDSKKSPHLRISFGDESTVMDKVKFSVTCYFAKQFDSLRKKCCPSEVDFVRSLSRCSKWNAQGGKSNVYFAKSLDERFIIKQVTKTELDSFEEFAPEYFKYLTDSLSSRSPTCLAKILGIYQVSIKNVKGGKETKIDLMVMENLFFKRNISRVYDLKGSARSRYNPDTTGENNVLLDMNLLETLRTDPIFLGSKAKRSLERAVWNDTSFLASVDVMDYSLLVGVDKESKQLVLGIIDYMRQYTWDKHLETWVKASGILGGPRNTSPTIISPKQYKRRFRKAMTTYFLTVPDQWSS